MPCTATSRPGSCDQASSAVWRFTCSNAGRVRVTTDRSKARSPRKSPIRRTTSLRSHPPASSEWTHSKNDRNAAANARASESDAPLIKQNHIHSDSRDGCNSCPGLALLQPVPPRAESAILRVLARSPGLIDSGEVTDRAGRRGVAVSLDSAYTGLPTRYTLIFDPGTGGLLGEEESLLGNPGRLGVGPTAVIAYTAFLSSGYVATPTARP